MLEEPRRMAIYEKLFWAMMRWRRTHNQTATKRLRRVKHHVLWCQRITAAPLGTDTFETPQTLSQFLLASPSRQLHPQSNRDISSAVMV